ncbi:hypothetical protein NQ176_g4140 [Zarea fungicola]|uniref:Uncharacterized protein n=1 Tax=Zarea fungicola TaxID=93591 RepID=A0ACC1NG71_9HYPO|nr:hypothetical protein NQ176_g4140 [Lecanicillium fungicola]
MMRSSHFNEFADLVVREDSALRAASKAPGVVTINGRSLTVADVVAVALYCTPSRVSGDAAVANRVQQSVNYLEQELSLGRTVYGVTTGFGGSADTRTRETEALQDGLVKMLNAGILLPSDKGQSIGDGENSCLGILKSHALPRAVVKATMLIRSNSLLRGHSGVRMSVIDTIMSLLDKDIVPVVPLRGSISASGDLGPLSYIAGAVQGNPDIYMSVGSKSNLRRGDNSQTVVTSTEALNMAGLTPQILRAKEGLGIVNGTSVSAALGAIVIHKAKQLGLLSQALTAMGTEALRGTIHNYDAFISHSRPHTGQREAAAIITSFLEGSQLATQSDPEEHGLAQDRYALRTAPQWIGPQLEDLLLAQRQVEVELNSTTDNPLIDVEGGRIHHGGNFQAMSLTSAMEKTILALQNFGRLIFAQCTELINNKTNNGLTPNLCVDEPSLSYTFKGLDITMAAYMSELASLAHPISPHVVSAEMGNQALNSLALIAARRAMECVEVLSLMSAAYILALCQAVDLRCLHLQFIRAAQPATDKIIRDIFSAAAEAPDAVSQLQQRAWSSLLDNWDKTSHLDLKARCQETASKSMGDFVGALKSLQISATMDQLDNYQTQIASSLAQQYSESRQQFYDDQDTARYLGSGSRDIYTYVRDHIGVPLHRGYSEPAPSVQDNADGVGSMASKIYMSIRNGDLPSHLINGLGVSNALYKAGMHIEISMQL